MKKKLSFQSRALRSIIVLFSGTLLFCNCGKEGVVTMAPGYESMDGTHSRSDSGNQSAQSALFGCFFCCSSSSLDAVIDTRTAPSGPSGPNSGSIGETSNKNQGSGKESLAPITTVAKAGPQMQESQDLSPVVVPYQQGEELLRGQSETEREAAATRIQMAVRGRIAAKQLAALKQKKQEIFKVPLKDIPLNASASIQTTPLAKDYNCETETVQSRDRKGMSIRAIPLLGGHGCEELRSQDKQSASVKSEPAGRYKTIWGEDGEQSIGIRTAPPVGRHGLETMREQGLQGKDLKDVSVGKHSRKKDQDERSTGVRTAPPARRYGDGAMQSQDAQSTGARSAPVIGCGARHKGVDDVAKNVLDESYDSSIASTDSFLNARRTTTIEFFGIKEMGDQITSEQDEKAGGANSAPVPGKHRKTITRSEGREITSPKSAPSGGYARTQYRMDDDKADILAQYIEVRMEYAEQRIAAKESVLNKLQSISDVPSLPVSLGLSSDSNGSLAETGVQRTGEEEVTLAASGRRSDVQGISEDALHETDKSGEKEEI